jgi:hypothetical protein
MDDKFDKLAKGLAQSATRRGALKKFGVGLVGIVMASVGLANRAEADKGGCRGTGHRCKSNSECCSGSCHCCPSPEYGGFGCCC